MLVFIDESGDTGRLLDKGSSKYFVISLLIFENNDEALRCDKKIDKLRRKLNKKKDYEFHFKGNSNRIRNAFLRVMYSSKFVYFSVVIDKSPEKLWGDGFNSKDSFYKYACKLCFMNAIPYLNNAIVVLDKSGSPIFRSSLSKYLRQNINNEKNIIKKLKQQKSHSNNLLQAADYIAGIINRKYQNTKDWKDFYKYIKDKEKMVQKWPK